MPDNMITLEVDGSSITVDIEGDTSITDISEDMTNVASTLAWYGSLWAAAREALAEVEDEYRAWRAEETEKLLEDDLKQAEWKVKNAIDSMKEFADYKASIRKAQRLVDRLTVALEALRTKADMLRSKGANARAELDSTSMKTKEELEEDDSERPDVSPASRQAREEEVRQVFRKHKR